MKPDLPSFEPGQFYLLKGDTLQRLMDELRRMAPQAGEGLTENVGNNGTTLARVATEQTYLPIWVLDEVGFPVLRNVALEPRYSPQTSPQ